MILSIQIGEMQSVSVSLMRFLKIEKYSRNEEDMRGVFGSMVKKRDLFFVLNMFLSVSNASLEAEAAAKKPSDPQSQCPVSPIFSVAQPVRALVLKKVGTQVFVLPNGSPADLQADLQTMLNTVVTQTPVFAVTDPTLVYPCDAYLELRSAVTHFQLDIAELGLSIGFNPGGSFGPVTGITGKVGVKVGTVAMDFSLWQCSRGRCTSVIASTANQTTASGSLALDIDFSIVHTGPSLLFQTPLGDLIRKIMLKGVSDLASSPRLNELPWQAQVKEYIPSAGLFIFDAGQQARLKVNQAFEVYAADSSANGVCDVYKTVAYAHTSSVDAVSSLAVVDQVLDSRRGILPGDLVMVRARLP
jgi:hypothetical protein